MIALGSDHAGYELKIKIMRYLKEIDVKFTDYGCYNGDAADYPVFAKKVCESMLSGESEHGILVCNSGIGMSIAANRHRKIRAALCRDLRTAVAAREHNDANVLVLGARVTDHGLALEIVRTFFNYEFSNTERHIKRVGMLDGLGQE